MNGIMSRSILDQASDLKTTAARHVREVPASHLDPLVDPRWGDVGDDVASPERRSFLSIAGSLLIEISLPKLLFAGTVLLLLPTVLLGIAPLVVTAWVTTISRQLLQLTEIGAALTGIVLIVLGVIAWRPLFRVAEVNFWSLNALAVQPGYALCREAIRHLAERMISAASTPAKRARMRAASSAVAGLVVCGCAVVIAALAWPASRWMGEVTDLASPHRLIVPTLANAIVLLSGYMAIATLIWGFADATMDQPGELTAFDSARPGGCTWRIAHLSDLHVVGERYGFRIESGRGGPRGNDRVERIMRRLEVIDRNQSLDFVLVSGDLTDAGLDGMGGIPRRAGTTPCARLAHSRGSR
jgi:hypothetical protein